MNENEILFSDDEPQIIGSWNWGAFFFGPLWGIFNGIYWPIIVMVVLNGLNYLLPQAVQSTFSTLINIIGLIICIYLGMKGNELAWNNKDWDDRESFERVQHKWAVACLWCIGITVVIGCIAILAIL